MPDGQSNRVNLEQVAHAMAAASSTALGSVSSHRPICWPAANPCHRPRSPTWPASLRNMQKRSSVPGVPSGTSRAG